MNFAVGKLVNDFINKQCPRKLDIESFSLKWQQFMTAFHWMTTILRKRHSKGPVSTSYSKIHLEVVIIICEMIKYNFRVKVSSNCFDE